MKPIDLISKRKLCPNCQEMIECIAGKKGVKYYFCAVGPSGQDYRKANEACIMADAKKCLLIGR